ncbi:MAG: V-type ATP synthase subunit B [Candidatus Latescibacterota bacterium]
MTSLGGKEYSALAQVSGPILTVAHVEGVGVAEVVEVRCPDGEIRRGTVLDISEERAVIQVFKGTSGLSTARTKVRFLGTPLEFRVSDEMLGRIFNGIGEPADGGPAPFEGTKKSIYGTAINPVSRAYPYDFIQTGISAIDGLNTLIRGQKLPILSGSGLPHNMLAAQILRQARIVGKAEPFAVIFAAMGIKHDDAQFFRDDLEKAGVLGNVTMFLNLADDPPEERIVTPRVALTLAEYLAFEKGMHVLVVLTDMTNYCEALREIASAREEVPSRKGYPGYLYSDLASIYERCGRIKGREGSITQIPILTMPNDDITHPIPDLTAYITEGQIVLSRELSQKGIYPPISVLPSLSRIMKDAIGEGQTRADHPNLASQLYASYSRVGTVRSLASIMGEEELTDLDRRTLQFGEAFETRFLNQGSEENRTMEETLDAGWKTLSVLPRSVLRRFTKAQLDQYYQG